MENFYFEPYTWNKTIFNMKFILFSKDALLPKIMTILLSKYWLKSWGISRSQYCKRFWFGSCIRKYYFELYVWNKRMFNMYFTVFSNNRLFPKDFDWLIALGKFSFWTLHLKYIYFNMNLIPLSNDKLLPKINDIG